MDYLVPIIFLLVAIYPVCRVVKKMGQHPFLGLFLLIPYVNVLMFYIFSSVKWPIECQCEELMKENARLKAELESARTLRHSDD